MRAEVQRYYGEKLNSTADLKTSACCTADAGPDYLRAALAPIHDEVLERYYGCGLVLPEVLDGAAVLDLGCGAGRDVYVLSQLVGEAGHIVGVDMTQAQLDVAERHRQYHAQRFGHRASNVKFLLGDIEHLDALGLADASFDAIVSNCVINLAADKRAVFAEAWRLLRPGGEMYFADVYADRRIPEHLHRDPELYGECLSGALYWNDFIACAREAGFRDVRIVAARPITVDDPALAERVADIGFYSVTCRLFRDPALEDTQEDYGQCVTYRGTATDHPARFALDRDTVFATGVAVPVSGNTARIITHSRLASHFDVSGDGGLHAGVFAASGGALPFSAARPDANAPPRSGGCC